jgi:GNAT superfamily N-acetyltransferase
VTDIQLDRAGLERAAADNHLRAMELLALHYADPRAGRRRFGTVEAMPVGHEIPFYNAIVALDPAASETDILAAIAWVESRGLAASVHLGSGVDAATVPDLERRGLSVVDRMTVMALDPIGESLDQIAPSMAAVRTGGSELADAWFAALEGGDRFRQMFSPKLIADPSVRIAVADLDGDPVAGAMAIGSDGGVLGVYAVFTMDRARRKGLGRAVTWAVIRAGFEAWGSRIAVLEATTMGVPLYQSMGFTEIGSVAILTRTAASPAGRAATR